MGTYVGICKCWSHIHIQWNPSNADTNGTHSTVCNIEASVFRRLPVIFLVGVAMSIRHAMAALATRWLVFVALAAKAIQGLNSVACNVESSDLAVWGEYSCGVDDV